MNPAMQLQFLLFIYYYYRKDGNFSERNLVEITIILEQHIWIKLGDFAQIKKL